MSMLDWILGAEAIGATIAAAVALNAQASLRAQVRFWRLAHKATREQLHREREARFLPPFRPRGRRFSLDAQETTKPG